MSYPVNNTTQPSEDYKPFPMVIPSSWDPITKNYHKNKLEQLKKLVTLATERGLMQQLVRSSTTQDEILVQPDDETELNKLIRENKKNQILSIKANEAIIQDQVEKSVISKKKRSAAVKRFEDNFKPVTEFKGDLSEFLMYQFSTADDYKNKEVFNQIYRTLYELQFPANEIEAMKSAINNAPEYPTQDELKKIFYIKKRLQALKDKANNILKKDLANLPQLTEFNANIDIFIDLCDELLTYKERHDEFYKEMDEIANSPANKANFGSVVNPPKVSVPDAQQISEDYTIANDFPRQPLPTQQVIALPPPFQDDMPGNPLDKKPLNITKRPLPLPPRLPAKEASFATDLAAKRSTLRPSVLASASPKAVLQSVDDPETGRKISTDSERYRELQQRYKTNYDGTFDYTRADLLRNQVADRATLLALRRRAIEGDDNMNQNWSDTEGSGMRKRGMLRMGRSGLPRNVESIIYPYGKGRKKGAEYRVDEEGKIGDVEVDMKKLAANVLKVKKGKKIIMQKPLTDGLRALLTKRFNKNMNYSKQDLDDYAKICKEGEVPLRGGNLKAEIVKGTIKPTKQSSDVEYVYYNSPEELKERLHIICGTIDNGNGSDKLKADGSKIIDILKGYGMISDIGAQTLLDSWL